MSRSIAQSRGAPGGSSWNRVEDRAFAQGQRRTPGQRRIVAKDTPKWRAQLPHQQQLAFSCHCNHRIRHESNRSCYPEAAAPRGGVPLRANIGASLRPHVRVPCVFICPTIKESFLWIPPRALAAPSSRARYTSQESGDFFFTRVENARLTTRRTVVQ